MRYKNSVETSIYASAMFGALELGGSAVIGTIATLFPITTSMPLGFTMIITSLMGVIALSVLKSKLQQ